MQNYSGRLRHLQLTTGAHIALASDSKGQVFGDHIVLEKGGGQMEQLLGYRIEARGLTLESQTGVAKAQVALTGAHMVQMAALTGSFRVLNAKGMVVATLTPGSALEFNPQAASQGEPWKLSGCLRSAAGHFTLTDDTTSVTVEASGAGLDREAGNRVEILGAMDPAATPVSGASQLIRVSQIKHLGNGCGVNKAAVILPAGRGCGRWNCRGGDHCRYLHHDHRNSWGRRCRCNDRRIGRGG